MCCWSFLSRLRWMVGAFLPMSLVMVVWSVVRMCVLFRNASAFSLDTRYTLCLGLRVVGVELWIAWNGIEVFGRMRCEDFGRGIGCVPNWEGVECGCLGRCVYACGRCI